ncbi:MULTISPECIES: hypothetical protein [Vibrio]|uniref:hypothetical protein n=1 Tax=Vibrio TaxID=662 RepID=UPI001483319A|nr:MULTISPECIES: hypothetical protein [Vibrio]MDQ2164978.1 hypothetical protein [Vibrio anguillarum]MDQ2189845.1 hypothetical protein [Vibrio sp. A14(2019)]MDQ2198022.1 hypothetical protein [Vibrio sp. 2017_1457_11]NNN77095.1 hypothetical protein [Vibrio sp. B7]NNN93921.1 hypothetical protein [Vibrio sp. B8-1]
MKIYRNIILLSFICLPFFTQAASMRGTITDNKLDWIGAMKISGGNFYTPTDWDIIHNLEGTQRWTPATHAAATPGQLNLSGPSGSVSAAIKVVGLEYNMGDLKPNQSGNVGSCEVLSMSNSTVALLGENCRSNLDFTYPSRVNPFYFTRPIVEVNEAELLSGFEGMEMGKYIGSVSLVARYEYYTSSGALTYSNVPYTFEVELDYHPSYLTAVTVLGNGIIEPVYNTQKNTISGSTSFNINASGYFNNGIKLYFINRDYTLNGPNKIPYSIQCQGACSASDIVKEGVLLHELIIVSEGQRNMTNINFLLDVGYENIHKDQVEAGSYNDTISIVFEENL